MPRLYHDLGDDDEGGGHIELSALRPGSSAPCEQAAGTGHRRRWRLPANEVLADCSQPHVQRRMWLAGAALVLLSGIAVFVSKASSPAAAASWATPPPWLEPAAGGCTLADAAQRIHSPLSYNLWLNLSDPAFFAPAPAGGFGAACKITFHVQQATSCLVLHAVNLTFTSITATLLTNSWSTPQQQQQQQPRRGEPVCLCGRHAGCATAACGRLFKAQPGSDAWLLSLGQRLAPAGTNLVLAATYTAQFGDRQGLWRSSAYKASNASDQQVLMLSTELETSAARRVLPCVDEPAAKATFVVSLEAPAGLAALSNMPEASRAVVGGGRELVIFQPSPPMSTYLLAVVVGDLLAVRGATRSGHLVRVWAAPGAVDAAALPLQLAVAALQQYQRFSAISQSQGAGTKWDLVAVPGKQGAVENWRLLTFDPERLLLPTLSAWALYRSADVICHEVAHQWFGNLVTSATWSDLLVNEGVASLAEYGCLAAVLPRAIGRSGAAQLMRNMAGPPHGVAAGVHEGPFAVALANDASPLAQPLLGSGSGFQGFGPLVYSKAASLLASLAQHAAVAAAGPEEQAALAFGPVAGLVGSGLSGAPTLVQGALRDHLNTHAFGTATAADVLQRFIALTPAAAGGGEGLASNPMAVLAGWQGPGSPVLVVERTPQGARVTQRRLCSWGLLAPEYLDKLSAQQQPAPPLPAAGTAGAAAAPGLACPKAAEGRERAVPWTPVLARFLPRAANTSGSGSGSAAGGQAGCRAVWQVIYRDQQSLRLPSGAGCPSGAAADLLVLEGDGGWALAWSAYGSPASGALRRWVAAELVPLMAEQQRAAAAAAAAPQLLDGQGLQLLLIAAKLLGDSAALGLSVFGDVPGAEVLAAVQAAAVAASAAAAAAASERLGPSLTKSPGSPGLGSVVFTLLAPLLPAAETLLDRLADDASCSRDVRAALGAALKPVALAALATLAPHGRQPARGSSSSSSVDSRFPTTDALLGSMALNRLLTATALLDSDVAQLVCTRFNEAVAAAAGSGDLGCAPQQLLQHIHPDLQAAVLDTAAAQPPGCQLDMPGDRLLSLLEQWHNSSPDQAVSNLAAFALAHAVARPLARGWQETLARLLGMRVAGAQQAPLPSGVPPAKHAAELAVIAARALAGVRQQLAASPVTGFLTAHWQQAVAALGSGTALTVLREVAAREVRTPPQWQALAAWVVQQQPLAGSDGRSSGGSPGSDAAGARAQQRLRAQGVLGAAWSTVAWVAAHQQAACADRPG